MIRKYHIAELTNTDAAIWSLALEHILAESDSVRFSYQGTPRLSFTPIVKEIEIQAMKIGSLILRSERGNVLVDLDEDVRSFIRSRGAAYQWLAWERDDMYDPVFYLDDIPICQIQGSGSILFILESSRRLKESLESVGISFTDSASMEISSTPKS